MVKYLCILFVMVIALPYCAFAVSPQLVNGNFEAGTTGWKSFNSTITAVAGQRTGGTGTTYCNLSTTVAGGSIYQTETGISADTMWWRVVGWVRLPLGNTSNFGFWGTLYPYGPASNNANITGTGNWSIYTIDHHWTSVDYADGYRDVQMVINPVDNQGDLDDIETFFLGLTPNPSSCPISPDWSLK